MTTVHHGQTTAPSRSRTPKVLKKLTSSERNSLDLDRSAAEQDGLGIYDGVSGGSIVPRAVHDVTSRRANHYRSTSGTSQFSTTTSGSGQRTGTFVHPFQQTPRPYTPPITGGSLHASYPNSIREGEGKGDGSESPALTEDDEDRSLRLPTNSASLYPRSSSNLSSRNNSHTGSLVNTSSCSPSLAQTPLRIQTKLPASSSRLYQATSNTNLNDNRYVSNSYVNNSNLQSPRDSNLEQIPLSFLSTSSTFPSTYTTPNLQTQTSATTSPTATMSPMSASNIRSSFDKGFRIRSRSDLTPAQNREAVQEARRKFEERERMKEEKAATDALKILEKRFEREARLQEKRKISETRRSSTERSNYGRPERSRSDLTNEKVGTDFREDMDFGTLREGFYTGDYGSSIQQSPEVVQGGFETGANGFQGLKEGQDMGFGMGMGTKVGQPPRRSTTLETTKRKTQSAWTRFMMWLRTRLMRLRSS